MPTQAEKANAFRALHHNPGAFVIPNPRDVGTARLLAEVGFPALATTSAGFGFSNGCPDAEGAVGREETLAHAQSIVSDAVSFGELNTAFAAWSTSHQRLGRM